MSTFGDYVDLKFGKSKKNNIKFIDVFLVLSLIGTICIGIYAWYHYDDTPIKEEEPKQIIQNITVHNHYDNKSCK